MNGNQYSTNNLITISELLLYFNYNSIPFIVEYNNCICYEKDWSNITIEPFDKLEIVTIVGGG